MQKRIFSRTGILRMNQSILLDADSLWQRFGCEEKAVAEGFEVVHFDDDMKLRRYYEFECQDQPDARRILVIDRGALYIPIDIARRFPVIRLTLLGLFPTMDCDVLTKLPGLDFDHLAFIADQLPLQKMDKQQTWKFCTESLRTAAYAEPYANALLDEAVSLATSAMSHRDWTPVAISYGKAAMFQHSGITLRGFYKKQQQIEAAFVKWIDAKYSMLSGVVDRKRPVLLSKVNDFIRKGNDKIALIVMDGMSFENFFTIQRMLEHEPFTYDVQASFSFFPTVTSVARQSIFSGKLPQEHSKPFSLENEEKQWFEYWREHGYRDQEIAFFKEEEPEIPIQTKVVGIVMNICDDLMHDELQGLSGLQQGVENWAKNMHLVKLLQNLQERGFAIYMTADHGNTSAVAEGRFVKPGVLAEPASRRAVIYQSFADAIELDKFTTERYSGTYLPEGYTAYLFDAGTSYGDRGKEYITHGGMTLEEAVVPFVRIGAYHG
ncbi:MAG: BREX-3 system phosphatase PglZ [Clostridia bacterium]|nr:BREX-3 system phosphatase PglZ [Clostridia bacterium]